MSLIKFCAALITAITFLSGSALAATQSDMQSTACAGYKKADAGCRTK